MTYRDTHHDAHRRVSDGLHPAIYAGVAILSLWFVISAWVFFGSTGYYAAFVVAVAAGLFFIAGAIPFLIWQVWRHNAPDGAPDRQPHTAFSDWWRGEVDTWQGRVEGWDAAVEVLMPLGVAAIGMTLIGLAFRLTAG